MRIPSGSTDRFVYFVAVDATDLKTRETGLSSFAVRYSLQGGASAAMTTPTVNETDVTNMPGVYELLIDESGMTTLAAGHDTEELCLHITQASMAPVTRVIEIFRAKFTEGQSATMANSRVNALTDAVTDGVLTAAKFAAGAFDAVWTVTNRTLTAFSTALALSVWDVLESAIATASSIGLKLKNNVDAAISSRLASAGYTAPDNAGIVAIKAKTDNLPVDPADQSLIIDATNTILADTNDIQARLPAALEGGRMAAALDAAGNAAISDKLLGRSIAGGADGGRTVKDALRAKRNKQEISGGILTVYEEDDVTPAWTAAVTTAAGNPISSIDPT